MDDSREQSVVMVMDISQMVGDSFEYAKDGLVGKWSKWILLIISCIIFPLIMGYMMRIYRGETPAPEPDNWGEMFIDGIKLFIVGLIYAIPAFIIGFVLFLSTMLALFAAMAAPPVNPNAVMGLIGANIFVYLIFFLVVIIIGLISATAVVRFARTNRFGEAFNFGAIFDHITKIGLVPYIIALIVMGIVIGVVELICELIPYVGFILLLIISPFLVLFHARYLCKLFDSAGTA